MLVMLQVTDPVERDHTMTRREGKGEVVALKGLLLRDEEFVRSAVQSLVQEALEAEMTEAIGAAKGDRTEGRVSYRSGYYQSCTSRDRPAHNDVAAVDTDRKLILTHWHVCPVDQLAEIHAAGRRQRLSMISRKCGSLSSF